MWQRIEQMADPIAFLIGVMNGEPVKRRVGPDPEVTPVEFNPTIEHSLRATEMLSKFMPPGPKTRPIKMALPKIDTADGVLKAAAVVADAMAAGEITPDEAQAIGSVLETQRRSIETVELEARIRALEGRGASGEGR